MIRRSGSVGWWFFKITRRQFQAFKSHLTAMPNNSDVREIITNFIDTKVQYSEKWMCGFGDDFCSSKGEGIISYEAFIQ